MYITDCLIILNVVLNFTVFIHLHHLLITLCWFVLVSIYLFQSFSDAFVQIMFAFDFFT